MEKFELLPTNKDIGNAFHAHALTNVIYLCRLEAEKLRKESSHAPNRIFTGGTILKYRKGKIKELAQRLDPQERRNDHLLARKESTHDNTQKKKKHKKEKKKKNQKRKTQPRNSPYFPESKGEDFVGPV